MTKYEPAVKNNSYKAIQKAPTGIKGLDEILSGGLPQGRVSLVCGGPGCGKTLLAMEFLVNGVQEFDEPGVFLAFEETAEDLAKNTASLGIDLDDLIARKKIAIDYVYIERSEIEETGEYDLEGLFVRLGYAIDSLGAKRVVLDTVETLFSGFASEGILRAELRRLFRWLKDRGVTAIVTGERGEGKLSRYGLEEYVSDCVILLENIVRDHISNRRLRVVKYRGSEHSSDEFPFLIDREGIWLLPVSSARLDYPVSTEHISTGIPRLDTMMEGKGFYRGSTILVSGMAGTGKTSIAAFLVDATCRRGERSLYLAFEESPNQIIRNMRSIGLNLEPWVQQGLLKFYAARPSMFGLENHLLKIQRLVDEFNPQVVVIDPTTNLLSISTGSEFKAMFVRLIDYLKMQHVTAMFTSLTGGDQPDGVIEGDISSLMDTWLLVRNMEANGERNRGLYILKSRGMAHSNQVREFCLSDEGINLVDVFVSDGAILTGAARIAHEAKLKAEHTLRQQKLEREQRAMARRRSEIQDKIARLQAELAAEEGEFEQIKAQEALHWAAQAAGSQEIAAARHADNAA